MELYIFHGIIFIPTSIVNSVAIFVFYSGCFVIIYCKNNWSKMPVINFKGTNIALLFCFLLFKSLLFGFLLFQLPLQFGILLFQPLLFGSLLFQHFFGAVSINFTGRSRCTWSSFT